MNEREALELFKKHDDPLHSEQPPAFERGQAIRRFRAFVTALEAATGGTYSFETGSQVQDASFHSQIYLDSGWLRFSNFGDMVSWLSDEAVDPSKLATVQRLSAEHGYTYVPAEFTDLRYTGECPGVDGISHWGIRFFDWI